MTAKRQAPYVLALAELRRRLVEGVYAPGARLPAAELAESFGLSPTPLREAIARLCGEGLLEDRHGLGAFVPRLTGRDVADLYRLSLSHLEIALRRAPAAAEREAGASAWKAAGDPVGAADRLFAQWIALAEGSALASSFSLVQAKLAHVRRTEPRVLGGLAEEWAGLCEAAGRSRSPTARAYHARRVRAAGRLADAAFGGPSAYSSDIV